MPLPLIPIIATGLAMLAARKVYDEVAEHPPLKGYCSHCGKKSTHNYLQSGADWKSNTRNAVLGGALMLGLTSCFSRDIYSCQSCKNKTLKCITPSCSGMARSTKYYDQALCGKCHTSNDKSKDFQDKEKLKSYHKMVKVIKKNGL